MFYLFLTNAKDLEAGKNKCDIFRQCVFSGSVYMKVDVFNA